MRISKSQLERGALWATLGLVIVYLAVATAMVVGEFRDIRAILAGDVAAPVVSGRQQTPEDGNALPSVGITGVQAVSNTLMMTVTVRWAGPGDLLYEPPELHDDRGGVYSVTSDSLEAARFAFLGLVTSSQAEARLAFSPAPSPSDRLTLVFNPHQTPDTAAVTPRLEVPVPLE